MADDIEETVPSLENLARSGDAGLRKLRRKDRFTARFTCCTRFPVRQRSDPPLIDGNVTGDCDADRVHRLRLRQSHDTACADHSSESSHRRMVEADAARVEHVEHFAEHFVCKHCRKNEITAAASACFSRRQQRGKRVAWMAAPERDIAIVEIEITDHHPIGEYGEIRAGLDTAAQYGRTVFRRYVRGELDCNLRRLRLVSADCA